MLLSSVRSQLCQVKPLVRLSTVNVGGGGGGGRNTVGRTIIKMLDSEGKPYYPVPELSSEMVTPEVREPMDRKRFNPKAYASYMKELSMRDVKQLRFDNRLTYITINHHHPDFVRAKLIIRRLTPERKLFIALEGKNIIRDALQCGLKLDKLFTLIK